MFDNVRTLKKIAFAKVIIADEEKERWFLVTKKNVAQDIHLL